jgi:hypothetical protein
MPEKVGKIFFYMACVATLTSLGLSPFQPDFAFGVGGFAAACWLCMFIAWVIGIASPPKP